MPTTESKFTDLIIS